MKLTKEFLKFMEIIREGEALGEIKSSKPITDFDLAVQFAIGKSFEKGIRIMTTADIYRAMIEYCGEDSIARSTGTEL